jgi:hypothetical protein
MVQSVMAKWPELNKKPPPTCKTATPREIAADRVSRTHAHRVLTSRIQRVLPAYRALGPVE